jgi:NAD(P)-dependent dehydrogenase (short-subunit alcohol dehydrogenase family)
VPRSYKDREAVVTGAASSPGRALAVELAARGAHLALLDMDSAVLSELPPRLAGTGVRVSCHAVDVACEAQVAAAAGGVATTHGAVQLLVNNAGISSSRYFERTTPEDFEEIVKVNFLGAVYACRAFLPLLKSSYGQVLNVARSFAWHGYAGKTAYASSKGALWAFRECLRLEPASGGVGVTVLYSGPMHTGIVRRGGAESQEHRTREGDFLERAGIPVEKVARAALNRLLNNPGRIVVGWRYRMLDLMARFSPGLTERAAAAGARLLRFQALHYTRYRGSCATRAIQGGAYVRAKAGRDSRPF